MIDHDESLELRDHQPLVPSMADSLDPEPAAAPVPQEPLGSSLTPEADQVSALALDLTEATLQGHGNQLSVAHRKALRQAVGLFTKVASGSIHGRYVLDLPTGLGKTTAIICWAKAMVALDTGWSLAICASRVEELCDIYDQLVSGEQQPVSPGHIGLWHAKPDAKHAATFRRGEEHRYGERPILLLTHQRVRQGETRIEERLRFQGSPRSLVVYDESLTTAEAIQFDYGLLAGQLKQVCAKLGYDQPVARLLRQLEEALDQEVAEQQAGASPTLIELPVRDAVTAGDVLDAISSNLGQDSELWRLIDHGPHPLRVIVIDEERKDATVIRYDVMVPDELRRLVILDASYPVRQLLRQSGDHPSSSVAQALRLRSWSSLQTDPMEHPKRYDQVTIHVMQTKGSGRTYVAKDLSKGVERSVILAEIAAVVREVPADEAVIIWTFLKSRDDLPDFTNDIREAMEGAGIDTKAQIEVDEQSMERIVVQTFGRETASNAYKYCSNVIFMGCLELSRQQIAGQFVAETRDLLANVPSSLVDTLVRGEVYHRLYQAISRAACRQVTVDEQGHTQAKPTRVWIMTRHSTIEQDLAEVLPGAQWHSWLPTKLKNPLIAQKQMVAQVIRQILSDRSQTKIGLKTLKALVEKEVGEVHKSTFQDARDLAIQDTEWKIVGQSLIYDQR